MANYVACPKCGTPEPEKLNFTWWGGVLGPRVLSHVKCGNCKHHFNGRTGKDNTTGIVIYTIAVGLVVLVVFVIVLGITAL